MLRIARIYAIALLAFCATAAFLPYRSNPNFSATTGHLMGGLCAAALGLIALALYKRGGRATRLLAALFSGVLALWGIAGSVVLLVLLPSHPKGWGWLEGAIFALGFGVIPGLIFLFALRRLGRDAVASGS